MGGRFFYFWKQTKAFRTFGSLFKTRGYEKTENPSHNKQEFSFLATLPSSPTRPSQFSPSLPHTLFVSSSLWVEWVLHPSSNLPFSISLRVLESVIWYLVGRHLSTLSSRLIRIGLVHFLILFFLLLFGIFRWCSVPLLLGLRSVGYVGGMRFASNRFLPLFFCIFL